MPGGIEAVLGLCTSRPSLAQPAWAPPHVLSFLILQSGESDGAN